MALRNFTAMTGGGGSDSSDSEEEKEEDQQDSGNSPNGGDSGGITQAASGFMRAGLNEDAGSEEIESDKHSAVGTAVDKIITEESQPNVTASDSDSGNKTETAVASEGVTGGDGGTGASVNTQTGEVDAGRPGDTSRVAEAVQRAASDDSDDSNDSNDSSGSDNSSDSGGPEWDAGANVTKNTWPGDPVSISAQVMNNGPSGTDGGGTATVTAAISGTGMSQSQTVELGGGGRRSLDFTFEGARSLSPGQYTATVSINGSQMDSATFTRHPENGGNVNSSSDIDSSNSDSSSGSQNQQSGGDSEQSSSPLPYTALTSTPSSGGGGSSSSSGSGSLVGVDPMMVLLGVVALGGGYVYTHRGS
ncbi:hypothetical protein [Halosimplex sp. J119]